MLLPTLLLWLWEERLRTRELQRVIRQQELQEQEQGGQRPGPRPGQLPPGAKPLPAAAALGWFAGTAWLLWLLLEALML